MIFRQHHDNQYLTVSNALVRDSAISFKATGLLVLLLSMPDGWEPQAGHLSSLKKDGRDAVEAGLRELEIAGYVVRRWVRQDGGKWEWEAHVYETPVALADRSNPAERTVNSRLARKLGSVSDNGESVMGEPEMGEPVTKKDLRDEVPKENNTPLTPHGALVLVQADVLPSVAGCGDSGFEQFWRAYPRKTAKNDALKAWKQTAKSRPPIDVLLRAVAEYRETDEVVRGYIQYPATWLRAGRWDDEPAPRKSTGDQDVWVRAARNMGIV